MVMFCILITALFAVIIALIRFYIRRTVYYDNKTSRLDGKTIIVTGSSSGIGKATVHELANLGARVILACRDLGKAEAVAGEIRGKTGNEKVVAMSLDLSSMKSVASFVRLFAERFHRVDILVNNAAYMGLRRTTEEGHDYAFQVNFLGHFYLTRLLLRHQAMTSSSPRMRIITVSTSEHTLREGFAESSLVETIAARDWSRDGYPAYAYTKFLLHLFSVELHRRSVRDSSATTIERGVISMAVNPGPTRSGLQRNLPGWFGSGVRLVAAVMFRDALAGAQSVLYCATLIDAAAEELGGKIVTDCRMRFSSATECMLDRAPEVWIAAERMCLDFEKDFHVNLPWDLNTQTG